MFCNFKVSGTVETSRMLIIRLATIITCIVDSFKDSVQLVARSPDIDSKESTADARSRGSVTV